MLSISYPLPMSDNSSPFRPALHAALRHSLQHLEDGAIAHVGATVTLPELRARINLPLQPDPIPAAQVVDELAASVSGAILHSAGPRFFGWVIGGSLPAALSADWLTSAWDQNAGLYATAPAAAVVEEVSGAWLKQLLGLPSSASFALVTGCQMAHVTCLAAARHHLLTRHGWDVEQKGLAGSPPIRILTSTECHSTAPRAVRFLGLGEANIQLLPADKHGRLISESLRHALEECTGAPTIVILQAGDLHLGAFDDFSTLIPLAHQFGAWVHVDGAFGLWAAASPKYRGLLRGVEAADSWAADGHKWLNVPYDCGYAFVAHPESHRAAISVRASYLTHDDEARDQVDWSPEFSRRGRGFATYAALRQLGSSGVADLVERCCVLAQKLIRGIGALEGAEVAGSLPEPDSINQGIVRFLHPAVPMASAESIHDHLHDQFTDQIIAAIAAEGVAFFTGSNWRGRRVMRISVCNWQTSEADIELVIASVSRQLRSMRAAVLSHV